MSNNQPKARGYLLFNVSFRSWLSSFHRATMDLSRAASLVEEDVSTTMIAIDKDKNSQYAVKWAVDNLLSQSHNCILIHVRSQSLHPSRYPSLSSAFIVSITIIISITQWCFFAGDLEVSPKEGRPPTESELQQFFLPYRGFCARRGVSKQPFYYS